MISFQEAIKIIEQSSRVLVSEKLSISEALGRVCSKDVIARENVPSFNNSAMDGYAVIAEDLKNASEELPVILNIEGRTAAGDVSLEHGVKGTAWEIMTGAPVPEPYNSVVKIEDTEVVSRDLDNQPDKISVNTPISVNKNVRFIGEDFRSGDALVYEGTKISPEHIMALASQGISDLEVYSKPSAAIITTGKELVDDCKKSLDFGQIRNSNGPYIMSSLSSLGVKAVNAGTIHDQPEEFEKTVSNLLRDNTDVIISTGAVSMGKYDFIPDSLKKLGAEILFHKVAIRPGKPVLFAKFSNGTVFFGLPGNPVSVAVGLSLFVYDFLGKLQGLKAGKLIEAKLEDDFKKKEGLLFVQKALASVDDQGKISVRILKGQESFKISPLLEANCWAILPAESSELKAGKSIRILPLHPDKFNIKNNQRLENESQTSALRKVS